MRKVVVVGAGAGGLVVAIGAAKAGKEVILIEKGTWGGDCTNFGCIPSKSLIASAHVGHAIKTAERLGLKLKSTEFEAQGALIRVRGIVAQIRSHEDAEALRQHGIKTIEGEAKFIDERTLEVNGERIQGDAIILAAGSRPRDPGIPGLTDYLTNETIFDLEEVPKRLGILGGGPIGCEMAQAFARLGSEVFLLHKHGCLLNREEPEAQAVVKQRFLDEGIQVVCNAVTEKIEGGAVYAGGQAYSFDKLLVSIGRLPNVEKLQLEQAGIAYTKKGISVDKFGRTSQKHIYALGDLTGIAPFTHMAENQARSVLTSLLLPKRKRWDRKQAVPRVTYTDPEVASAGMSEADAIEKYGEKRIATYVHEMKDVDRAITSGETDGFIKVVTRKYSSKILGVCIVSPRAGEMLNELTLAMQHGIPLRKIASLVHPYPTYSLGIRQTADKWLTQTLLPLIKRK